MPCLMEAPKLAPQGDQQLVQRLALRVVSELTRNSCPPNAAPNAEFRALLVQLAYRGDADTAAQVFDYMKRRRMCAEAVVDIYLPAAVHQIGTAWHDGELNILDATLAISRLQVLLRDISSNWSSDKTGRHNSGRVLLLLPPGEQHSMGAMVAASQIRRAGVSVKVGLLPDIKAISTLMEASRFQSVFISASNQSVIAECSQMIATIRASAHPAVPIVLGGGLAVANHTQAAHELLRKQTRADHVTADVKTALQICGLVNAAVAAG
jgi:methylmalonyl-CoA mutase cobalamin-binding subunit